MNSIRSCMVHCGFAVLVLAPALVTAQVHFYGVGDLPGGLVQSDVRDTARVGSVLYAVGGVSTIAGSLGDDTAFLWTSTGGMTPLPPLTAGVVAPNVILAGAITPDAAYIASRARFNPAAPGQRHGVRVTTSGLVNLDLGALPGFPQNSVATAISNDGSVLYGWAKYDAAGDTQAVRYTAAGPTVTAIPFLNAGDDTSSPAPRATSSDGSVMVGTSYNSVTTGNNSYGPGNAAFRFVQGGGVTAIPVLPGGTWNVGVAVSPDGNLAMAVGDSSTAPYGEVYLYNAATTATTAFGTPVAGWVFNGIGGMNVDGSLAAIAMYDPQGVGSASFVHNANGWHEVQPIVAGAGVDLTGWSLDTVEGISSDGTRIWGAGTHNGNQEGFIVEFPARYLSLYGASLPAQSIAGSYTDSDTTQQGASVIAFLANGSYFQIQDASPTGDPAGFERGTYTWDAVTKAITFTTIIDTNGDGGTCPGLCGTPGILATKLGDITTLLLPGAGAFSARLVTGNSPIVGAWVFGDTTMADSSSIVTFFANGIYMQAYDGPADVNHPKGMERGTYMWDSVTGAFTATTLVDTNGTAGLSNPAGAVTVTITGNTLTYDDGTGPVAAYRVIAAPLAPSVAVTMSRKPHAAAGPFDLVTGP
jgi:hypothetical protein